MQKLTNKWTEADLDRLKVLVAAGASPHRAAVAMKRSVQSVQNKARDFGTPFPSMIVERMKLREAMGTNRSRR